MRPVTGQRPLARIRPAQSRDAAAMGELYVAAWRDSYPAILPHTTLGAMSASRAARRFTHTTRSARELALVAQGRDGALLGLSTGGKAIDRGLKIGSARAHGEIYTLYVDPFTTEQGLGRLLLRAMLSSLAERGHENAVVWVLQKNPARFFYERMGAHLIATKSETHSGEPIALYAYAWPSLASTFLH